MSTHLRRGRWGFAPALMAAGLALAAIAQGLVAPAAEAAPISAATDRQEQQLWNRNGVAVSYVSYRLPLPKEAPAHSAKCDRFGYVRYRAADGPTNAKDAAYVVTQQQGFGGGAVNSDGVANNTVSEARKLGKKIEFWAIARRSACLDENTGFDYALKTKNYLDAVDYYFNGKPINGKKFPGFKTNDQLAVLDYMGTARINTDQYQLMLAEIPDQAVRQRKYVCAGISFGGPITGLFANWDFDGNPNTRKDAGYQQCAAFAGQDTLINSDPVAIQNTPFFQVVTDAIMSPVNSLLKTGFRAGALPRTLGQFPLVGVTGFLIQRLAGLAAYLQPNAESKLLKHLPRTFDIDSSLNITFAPTWSSFVTSGADGSGSIRDFRFTNAALLGVLTDNNTNNFALSQSSTGALAGGPVMEKTFPVPGSITQIPLAGTQFRVMSGPATRVGPTSRTALYTWRNYDNVRGVWYTAPSKEIQDQRDQARTLAHGSPSAYWESYFPLRTAIDVGAAYSGVRSGDMVNLRYHAMDRIKPNYAVFGGDSFIVHSAGMLFPPPQLATVVTAPGYNHIDTIAAAAVQNDGSPDYSGHSLARFMNGLG